ncbi:response regulator transcription factor (plasmid) [Sphingobium sp. SJ10-10]|uniref:response regulator transcription factor n=1 Tax=Sphingobium sp. SJ10-10 TaxID=3114999 RepID=UPI002E185299|nr:response regulator transcription factor [Sphingobium sp. SJ10-10]
MTETRSIAVVAERHIFYNAGLAAMLRREVGFAKVIRVHDYGSLAKILSTEFSVDFLALDFDLPGSSGLATIRELHEKQPAMRMAVFSDRTDLREVLSIISAGAHGFIPKQIGNGAELLKALQTVDEDGIFVPAELLERQRPQDDENEDEETINLEALSGLTDREQQVIRLLLAGHTNKVIARELGISPSTVKVHVHAAFRTLGVHSRLAALAALRVTRRTGTEA